MNHQKEAYGYENYVGKLTGGKIKEVRMPYVFVTPTLQYSPSPFLDENTLTAQSEAVSSDDFLGMKVDMAKDKISLITGQINARRGLSYDIIGRIYDDLFLVEKLRTGLPFPDKYQCGKPWSDLNSFELQLKSEIRRELRESSKDTAFPEKDLRDSVLDFKVQKSKSDMLKGGLDEIMELDSSYQQQGDTHPPEE